MSTLFFTVCSLQQYPQALALGQSLRQHYPHYPFFIGLVDRLDRLPDVTSRPFGVVDVESVEIPEFNELCAKYTWLEVLHAVRPFFALHFLRETVDADCLVFLGPESWVLAPLTEWLAELNSHSIVLLPQRLQPPLDAHWPAERHFLNVGVYQGEAWALRRSSEAERFLAWWSARLHENGWLRLCDGYGLDQLWLNLVSAFFEDVGACLHPGYGVGYGNADERALQPDADTWRVAGQRLALVSWMGLDVARLRWEPHRTDRPMTPAWQSLAAEYRRGIAPVSMPEPAFGQSHSALRTPRGRYRFIWPLRRLVAWIDRVPLPFLR